MAHGKISLRGKRQKERGTRDAGMGRWGDAGMGRWGDAGKDCNSGEKGRLRKDEKANRMFGDFSFLKF